MVFSPDLNINQNISANIKSMHKITPIIIPLVGIIIISGIQKGV